jgi:hypothetical protein
MRALPDIDPKGDLLPGQNGPIELDRNDHMDKLSGRQTDGTKERHRGSNRQRALPWRYVWIAKAGRVEFAALAYVIARRAPVRFQATFGRQIGFCFKLNAAVALALMIAMGADLVLTGIRLFEAELDARALVPFVTLMLEAAVAGGSLSYILIMMSRCSRALRLAA